MRIQFLARLASLPLPLFVFPNVLLLSFVNATNSEVLFFFYTIFGEIKNEIKFKNACYLHQKWYN